MKSILSHKGDTSKLGATIMDGGVNFAVFSDHAEALDLCLFDDKGQESRVEMAACSNGIWTAFIPNLSAGQRYGYRAHGAYAPHLGHRFNPHKLLVDPYAKAVDTGFRWSDRHFAYERVGEQVIEHGMDIRDNADVMCKSLVASPIKPYAGQHPNRQWEDTVFYETHVKGFTAQRLDLDDKDRGRFAGLASDQCLEYLKALGITALELMPIHAKVDEYHLHRMGLTNYWGYSTLNFFAVENAFGDAAAFRRFVEAAHDKGIEVILDVVYNHTCEGNHLGPTFSYKGLDNKSYYRLNKDSLHHYADETGCGATLETTHNMVQKMVVDSLEYWVEIFGVDGFRFDLAPVLGSTHGAFDRNHGLMQSIGKSKTLKKRKLIAEPWSAVGEGYALGEFPKGWAEWNDRARDSFRGFWHSHGHITPAEMAQRICGSGDLFFARDRGPAASVNMVACHDGYTLADCTQYLQKHNWVNGENNHDGHGHNLADNFGHEGPSGDSAIKALRQKRRMSLLATVFLSAGTPLLYGGDEFGRSQMGNNNAYAQDNSINWFDWTLLNKAENKALFDFTKTAIALRQKLRHFKRNFYLPSAELDPLACDQDAGILWRLPDGQELSEADWHSTDVRAFAKIVLEYSTGSDEAEGALFFAFNASSAAQHFALPELEIEGDWQRLLDTSLLVHSTQKNNENCNKTNSLCVQPGAFVLIAKGRVWREV